MSRDKKNRACESASSSESSSSSESDSSRNSSVSNSSGGHSTSPRRNEFAPANNNTNDNSGNNDKNNNLSILWIIVIAICLCASVAVTTVISNNLSNRDKPADGAVQAASINANALKEAFGGQMEQQTKELSAILTSSNQNGSRKAQKTSDTSNSQVNASTYNNVNILYTVLYLLAGYGVMCLCFLIYLKPCDSSVYLPEQYFIVLIVATSFCFLAWFLELVVAFCYRENSEIIFPQDKLPQNFQSLVKINSMNNPFFKEEGDKTFMFSYFFLLISSCSWWCPLWILSKRTETCEIEKLQAKVDQLEADYDAFFELFGDLDLVNENGALEEREAFVGLMDFLEEKREQGIPIEEAKMLFCFRSDAYWWDVNNAGKDNAQYHYDIDDIVEWQLRIGCDIIQQPQSETSAPGLFYYYNSNDYVLNDNGKYEVKPGAIKLPRPSFLPQQAQQAQQAQAQ